MKNEILVYSVTRLSTSFLVGKLDCAPGRKILETVCDPSSDQKKAENLVRPALLTQYHFK